MKKKINKKISTKYQVHKYEMRFFFKENLKFGRMKKCFIQNMIHRLLYSFPFIRTYVNATSVKIFSFCCEPFVEPFFHIFVRTKTLLSKCATHRCKQAVIGKSQVWWVIHMGQNFPAECFQRVANRFCHMRLCDAAFSWRKMALRCPLRYSGLLSSREQFKSVNCCW